MLILDIVLTVDCKILHLFFMSTVHATLCALKASTWSPGYKLAQNHSLALVSSCSSSELPLKSMKSARSFICISVRERKSRFARPPPPVMCSPGREVWKHRPCLRSTFLQLGCCSLNWTAGSHQHSFSRSALLGSTWGARRLFLCF